MKLSLKGGNLTLCGGLWGQAQWGADTPRVGDLEDSWMLGNRTLVLLSLIFIGVTKLTTLTHSLIWGDK